jgi:hypothetical protein
MIAVEVVRRSHQEPETIMADKKTYTGGCHCGEVRFEVTADISSVVSCNCSICQKRGALWVFVPVDSFALRAGAEDLKDYQFGKKSIHHEFCGQCGVGAFSRGTAPDGSKMVAVNVRCLDEVDIAALKLTPFDGRSM